MSQLDATAIETLGIPRLLLMEHAGLALAHCAQTLVPTPSAPLLVCCGTGFNGGDGLCAARHLHQWGYSVRVVVTGSVNGLREEPAIYARIAQRLGLPLKECPTSDSLSHVETWLAECGLMIDALVGIGARGPMREPLATLIERMNRSGRAIIAADIPSGLDADTGSVQGVAIRATVTVAFGLPKRGCFLEAGPAHTGSLIVDSITIPPILLRNVG